MRYFPEGQLVQLERELQVAQEASQGLQPEVEVER